MNTCFKSFIEDVKSSVNIRQVVSDYVQLDSRGMGKCPFHHDTNPSFSVNEREQFWYCFGCTKGGDVISFIMKIEGLTFWEAVCKLADMTGLMVPTLDENDRKKLEESNIIQEIHTQGANFYHKNLTDDARKYLIDTRGLSQEMIDDNLIGYAGSADLASHLLNQCGFSREMCINSGLVKQNPDGSFTDFFRGYITFPHIRRGRVENISGRVMDDSEPRHKHLPGEIKHFYNEDAINDDRVFLCEGISDTLSLQQNGFPAIGVLGVNGFKEKDLVKLEKCKMVYLVFDGDEAGRKGALETAKLIGEKASIISLPDGIDPNEYFRDNSKEDFEGLIAKAQNVIEHMVMSIPEKIDPMQLPDKVDPILDLLSRLDPIKCEAYLKRYIKPRFDLDTHEMNAYRSKIKSKRKEHDSGDTDSQKVEAESDEPNYLALAPDLVDIVDNNGIVSYLMAGSDGPQILEEIEIDGTIYSPPPQAKIQWQIPRAQEVLRHYKDLKDNQNELKNLYNDLVEYFKSVSEMPAEGYYTYMVLWTILTYFQEVIQYFPMTILFALPERGKSRTGKAAMSAAYRGVVLETINEAYIIRIAKNCGVSIFLDMMDAWNTAVRKGVEDFILCRFEKGHQVPKVLYPDRGAFKDTEYYVVFGPTILGSNHEVNEILNTRAIQINMPEASRKFDNDITSDYGIKMRERLIAMRALYLNQMLPEVEKPCNGRLGDIMRPLLQVAQLINPDCEQPFREFIDMIREERSIGNSETMEAKILKTLVALEKKTIETSKGRILSVEDILIAYQDEYCLDDRSKREIHSQNMGYQLRNLGFQKARTRTGNSAIIWDEDMIDRLLNRFGINKENTIAGSPNLDHTIYKSGGSGGSGGFEGYRDSLC